MNKRIKLLIVLLGTIICAVTLIMANTIIMNTVVRKDYRLIPAKLDQFHGNESVTYWVDKVQVLDDEFSKVYIEGWAFCETDFDNEMKTIDVVLVKQNSDKCYYSHNLAGLRPDVRGVYPNARGNYHALFCQFVTYALPNGTYDVYFYVTENEHTKGLVDTQYDLSKNGREVVWEANKTH